MVYTPWRLPHLTFVASVLSLGCAGTRESAEVPVAGEPKTSIASLTCPNLSSMTSGFDFMQVFGIDAVLDARLDRAMALAAELEATVSALEADAKEACSIIARDLGATITPDEHPCDTLVTRVDALRASLGSGAFSMSVSSVSCGVSLAGLEECAGECLTGMAGVTSAVSCGASLGSFNDEATCGLDFALPHASSCLTQCGARSLRQVRCSADIDVRIGHGETPQEYWQMVQDLRRDLPKLAGLAASVGPRAVHLAREATQLIDDIAATIDALADAGSATHTRAVAGAVLAGCVGPRLADVIRSSASLETTLTGALRAHATLVAN